MPDFRRGEALDREEVFLAVGHNAWSQDSGGKVNRGTPAWRAIVPAGRVTAWASAAPVISGIGRLQDFSRLQNWPTGGRIR